MRNGNRENELTPEKKKPYVKKPLNAFMLFMKEQRAKVIQEGTLKESAAINQILGRKVSTKLWKNSQSIWLVRYTGNFSVFFLK